MGFWSQPLTIGHWLLKDRSRREKLGEEGKRKAGSVFQWGGIASQYEKVLEAAISKGTIPS